VKLLPHLVYDVMLARVLDHLETEIIVRPNLGDRARDRAPWVTLGGAVDQYSKTRALRGLRARRERQP
jgi:hypothetical protein